MLVKIDATWPGGTTKPLWLNTSQVLSLEPYSSEPGSDTLVNWTGGQAFIIRATVDDVAARLNGVHNEAAEVTTPLADPPRPFDHVPGSGCGEFPGAVGEARPALTDAQVNHMVGRFLGWPIPDDFRPDNGVTAQRPNYAPGVPWGLSGTNLFDHRQATAMVRYMLQGLPAASPPAKPGRPPQVQRAYLSDAQ